MRDIAVWLSVRLSAPAFPFTIITAAAAGGKGKTSLVAINIYSPFNCANCAQLARTGRQAELNRTQAYM